MSSPLDRKSILSKLRNVLDDIECESYATTTYLHGDALSEDDVEWLDKLLQDLEIHVNSSEPSKYYCSWNFARSNGDYVGFVFTIRETELNIGLDEARDALDDAEADLE